MDGCTINRNLLLCQILVLICHRELQIRGEALVLAKSAEQNHLLGLSCKKSSHRHILETRRRPVLNAISFSAALVTGNQMISISGLLFAAKELIPVLDRHASLSLLRTLEPWMEVRYFIS